MSTAVRFENVSKLYKIGLKQQGLREVVSSLPRRIFHKKQDTNGEGYLWALKDLNLEVEQGKVLGVIGPNGAGKTTMLKLMSKVTKPKSGKISIDGRVSALIELGAGFHPDLTGLENIYLNGVILGLTRKEIDKKLDSIIQFSELERFIYTPVKRYSSGMYARLGFSVAAHVDPDILLVDEVLAVGDEAFQLKCHNFIHGLVRGGRTSIFVSHNLYAIEQLCDRVIWMDKGRIVQDGTPQTVLRAYMDETDRRLARLGQQNGISAHAADGKLKIHQLRVLDANGIKREAFETGEDILIKIDYETRGEVGRPFFCVWISDAQSTMPLISANMLLDDYSLPETNGPATITCHFKDMPLMPRTYNVWVEVYGKDRSQLLYMWRILGSFRVLDPNNNRPETGAESRGSVRFSRAHAFVKVPYEWQFEEELVDHQMIPR